jgi:hypothetical protein
MTWTVASFPGAINRAPTRGGLAGTVAPFPGAINRTPTRVQSISAGAITSARRPTRHRPTRAPPSDPPATPRRAAALPLVNSCVGDRMR